MAGTALQEIEERVEKTRKPHWEHQGEIKTFQKLIIENLTERFDVVGPGLTEKIQSIQSLETLNALFRKTNRVNSLEEFKELVNKAMDS
jgi:hypothetical protein